METFYLIDFENVHNDGIANIESMTKEEHVHIFSTQNATNIRQDIFWLKEDSPVLEVKRPIFPQFPLSAIPCLYLILLERQIWVLLLSKNGKNKIPAASVPACAGESCAISVWKRD